MPNEASKMEAWFTQGDTITTDGKVDRDEYYSFRTYIQRVGQSGCVSSYASYRTKDTKDFATEQFALNTACKVHTAEAVCVAPCVW